MTTTEEKALRALHETLTGRTTPEAVMSLIQDLGATPPPLQKKMSRKKKVANWHDPDFDWEEHQYTQYISKMPSGFEPVSSIARAVNVLAMLIGLEPISEEDGRNPAIVRAVVECGRSVIEATDTSVPMSFKEGRRNREARTKAGIGEMSRRRYDKLYRIVQRLDGYIGELEHQNMMFEMGRFAKTVYAPRIPWELFSADIPTAAFVAYLTANLGRRSLFTNASQAKGFDTRAEALFKALEGREETRWAAVAAVLPRQDVLQRVTNEDRYLLLEWTSKVLTDTAEGLRVAAEKNEINRQTMIVHKGNDSSTWNALAGAWNKARDFWLAIMFSMGAGSSFKEFLPGKVMRLMAADVAYWHQATGGKLDDNTHVWSILPPPWEVLMGRERCGLDQVVAACAQVGIDPEKTAWTAPRAWLKADTWRPTPETVHGIAVSNPDLALFLRKVGVFSGKTLKTMTPEEEERARQGWESHVVRIEAAS